MDIKELQKKKLQSSKYLEKHKLLDKEILQNCHHPEDFLVNKEYYYSGDYLNTSYTEYWRKCTICGKCSEITTKYHGSYA